MAESAPKSPALKKSRSAPKLKLSKEKLKETSPRKSSPSKEGEVAIPKSVSSAGSEYLLAQQSASRSRTSDGSIDAISPRTHKGESKSPREKSSSLRKEKTPSQISLASQNGSRPLRAQSGQLGVRRYVLSQVWRPAVPSRRVKFDGALDLILSVRFRRSSSAESSDSIGEAFLEGSSSPERESHKRPRFVEGHATILLRSFS